MNMTGSKDDGKVGRMVEPEQEPVRARAEDNRHEVRRRGR